MFSDQEYCDFIQKLKDIKSPGHKMVPGDFYLMKRLELAYYTLIERLDMVLNLVSCKW